MPYRGPGSISGPTALPRAQMTNVPPALQCRALDLACWRWCCPSNRPALGARCNCHGHDGQRHPQVLLQSQILPCLPCTALAGVVQHTKHVGWSCRKYQTLLRVEKGQLWATVLTTVCDQVSLNVPVMAASLAFTQIHVNLPFHDRGENQNPARP
jgi:hypothetical protein